MKRVLTAIVAGVVMMGAAQAAGDMSVEDAITHLSVERQEVKQCVGLLAMTLDTIKGKPEAEQAIYTESFSKMITYGMVAGYSHDADGKAKVHAMAKDDAAVKLGMTLYDLCYDKGAAMRAADDKAGAK